MLRQSYSNIEVCLVDDNAPNDEYSQYLKDVLKKYDGDSRVRYICQREHINGAVARNAGIEAASGEYIAFLDDDDEWLPDKIEKQMAIIQADPSLDGATTLWTLYENGQEVRKCPVYTAENLQFKVFSRSIAVYTSTVIIKKNAIKRFGGFDQELSRHQDLQFLVDALQKSKFEVVSDYLVRLHADSDINRPDVRKLIVAKKKFFHSVQPEFEKYSKKEQKRILNAHYYEVAFSAVRSKEWRLVAKYMIKAGINPDSIRDVLKRYKSRK